MLGTIVNAAAILLGGAIGLLLKKGSPARVNATVMSGVGLVVLYIGIDGALEGQNVLIAIIAIVVGGVLGALLNLNDRFEGLAHRIERLIVKDDAATGAFGEGFVTATLLFCIGAMAVVGSLQSGLAGNHEVLFAKSLIDGISAAMLASTLGAGVLLSALPVLLYQGAITLLAGVVSPFLSDAVVAEMTCVGSLLIVAIALNLLRVTRIKVMDYVIAIFLPILLCLFL